MKYKNKFRYTVLKLLLFCLQFVYRLYLILFGNRKQINSRILIESYYKNNLVTEICPRKVKYYLPVKVENEGITKKRCGHRFICGGNWENEIRLIEEHRKTKDMFELFEAYENQKRYSETYAFSRHVEELKQNNLNIKNEPPREVLDNMDKIHEYYTENTKLYKTIKKSGYARQTEVKGGLWNREVGIAIGKHGEIYRFGNGYHRMAIAKFMKLDRIPVVIKLIHTDFYEYCKNKYQGDPIIGVIREFERRNP